MKTQIVMMVMGIVLAGNALAIPGGPVTVDKKVKIGSLTRFEMDKDYAWQAEDLTGGQIQVDLRKKSVTLTLGRKGIQCPPNARCMPPQPIDAVVLPLRSVEKKETGEVIYRAYTILGENAPVAVFEGNTEELEVHDLSKVAMPEFMFCALGECPAHERLQVVYKIHEIRGIGIVNTIENKLFGLRGLQNKVIAGLPGVEN